MRKSIRVTGAAVILMLLLAGPVTGRAEAEPAGPTVPTLPPAATAVEACDALFGRTAFDEVPAEALVSPGELLSLNLVWGTGWKRGAPVEVFSCTAVDGAFSAMLSSRNRDVVNDGVLVVEFNVPADLPDRARLCERAVVVGQSPAGAPMAERLDARCFGVAAAVARSPKDGGAVVNDGGGAASKEHRAAAGSPQQKAPRTTPGRVAGDGGRPGAPATAPSGAVPEGPSGLPRTGTGGRMLAAVAGLLLVLGGRMVAWSGPSDRKAPYS